MKEIYSSPKCNKYALEPEGMMALSDPAFNNPYQNPDTGLPEELEW